MDWKISGAATIIDERTHGPLLIAIVAGALAMAMPTLAILMLAGLAALVLLSKREPRVDLASLAGPACAAVLVGAFAGLAGGIGVVFVWRFIADASWSARHAGRLALAEGRPAEASRRALAHAWLTPLFGLTVVAYTAPHMVAGLPLDLPHVPLWVPLGAGIAAAIAFLDWALKCASDWRLGELAAAPAAHLLAHHAIFLLAFGLTLDVSAGVVALIAWRLAHAAPLRQASFTAVP